VTERNPNKVTRARPLVFLLFALAGACAGTPVLTSGPPRAEFPQRQFLTCSESAKLPAVCQIGPHDRRFAELPSQKGAVARGAYEEAGQMGEEAAVAKRLFDEERYAESTPLLARVAYGETKDDAGNRQLGDYYLAVALYKQNDLTGAADIFGHIARTPNHLRFNETLLWIFKLLTSGCVTSDLLSAVVRYTPAERGRPKEDWTRPQPGIPEAALFVSARARFQDGRKLESVIGFRDLVDDPQWGPLARECITLATK
jgi:hypothetical protein